MAQEKYVHGYKVLYEDRAQAGIDHLNNHLTLDFAKVFFVYAKHYGVAPFEDQGGRQYLLNYKNELFILDRKA